MPCNTSGQERKSIYCEVCGPSPMPCTSFFTLSSRTWLPPSLRVQASQFSLNGTGDSDEKSIIVLYHNIICTNAQNQQKLWAVGINCPRFIFGGIFSLFSGSTPMHNGPATVMTATRKAQILEHFVTTCCSVNMYRTFKA